MFPGPGTSQLLATGEATNNNNQIRLGAEYFPFIQKARVKLCSVSLLLQLFLVGIGSSITKDFLFSVTPDICSEMLVLR